MERGQSERKRVTQMAWMHLILRGLFAAPPSIEMKARLSGAHPGNTLSNSVTTQANPHGNLNGCTVAKGLKVGFERSA